MGEEINDSLENQSEKAIMLEESAETIMSSEAVKRFIDACKKCIDAEILKREKY